MRFRAYNFVCVCVKDGVVVSPQLLVTVEEVAVWRQTRSSLRRRRDEKGSGGTYPFGIVSWRALETGGDGEGKRGFTATL